MKHRMDIAGQNDLGNTGWTQPDKAIWMISPGKLKKQKE